MLSNVNSGSAFMALLQSLQLAQGPKPAPSFVPVSAATGSLSVNVSTVDTSSQPHLRPFVGTTFNEFQPQQKQFAAPNAVQSFTETVSECNVEPYTGPFINQTFPAFDETRANIYRYRQQQSVNLGSWFVHEQWMTPSLFACASGPKIAELDIAYGWGSPASARAVLERHWDSFIDQSDFQYLASIGINTVRLPIGYWNLGPHYCEGTQFAEVGDIYLNSWSRVVRAINMAGEAGIGVLVDLHGAIGSQNGQPHSGIADGQTNLFRDPANMEKTISVLIYLMEQLTYVTNVVGIQLLNEPVNVPELADFYTRAISAMRATSPAAATFPLYIHDGFDLDRFSRYIADRTDFVVQDHHSYFVFTPADDQEPAHKHTDDVKTSVSESLADASALQRRNLIVGEWSCALTPQSIANEADKDETRRQFCTGQMDVYANATAGWSFWSYKKEECDGDQGWCFKAAVGHSLPSTFFSYGPASKDHPSQFQCQIKEIPNAVLSSSLNHFQQPQAPGQLGTFSRRETGVRHRFDAIQQQRIFHRDSCDERGYADGRYTAKSFAACGMSKLGFVDQYIEYTYAVWQPATMTPGVKDCYRGSFLRGLRDEEAVVWDSLSGTSS